MNWRQQIRGVVARAREAAGALEHHVMPPRCAFCGVPGAPGAPPVCAGCEAELPWISHRCRRCGLPLPAPVPTGVDCARCQLAPPAFDAVVAPLSYRFPVDAAIRAFKFHRRLSYAPAFVAILTAASACLPAGIDALLPVPLHWQRQAVRGFNQAEELGRPLARVLGVSLLRQVRRSRRTPFQSGLHARERRRNLSGAFAVSGDIPARHVVIVDDVVTTGTTCAQLAALLKAVGVTRVSVLAIARAASRD